MVWPRLPEQLPNLLKYMHACFFWQLHIQKFSFGYIFTWLFFSDTMLQKLNLALYVQSGAHKGKERSTAHIYAMELSKTKLCRVAHFKNFHIRKFLDSRTTILTSRMAKMADSVEGIQRHHRQAEAPLERKSTKRRRKF